MKALVRYSLLLFSGILLAQSQTESAEGAAYVFNPQNTACVTPQDYDRYKTAVQENIAALEAAGNRLYTPNKTVQQVSFEWPVAQADGFDYNSFWSISNYVDHNDATNQLEDWNCGNRTYDTSSGYDHQGLDIFTWPFTWKMVEDEQGLVIAAAAGQIVYKNDGSYDRNCSFNNDQWNAIFVEHSDGSVAWYGHMKSGSLNDKQVGDTITAGERLGVIASSGNSTGPHLHFEVYDADDNLIDPYVGPCNDSTDTSWWSDQKEYTNPGINTVLVHDAPPQFNTCPENEIPNDVDQIDAGGTLYFASYYRDQTIGETAFYKITDPNGDIYSEWSQTFTDFFYASYWYWQIDVSDIEGTWTFEVSYANDTVSRSFTVGELSISEVDELQLQAFPNPVQDRVTLTSNRVLESVTIYNLQGRLIKTLNPSNIEASIDLRNVPAGIYFATVQAEQGRFQQTVRLLKK